MFFDPAAPKVQTLPYKATGTLETGGVQPGTMRVLLVLIAAVSLCAGDRCARECARRRQGSVRLDSQEVGDGKGGEISLDINAVVDTYDSGLQMIEYSARLVRLECE